MRPARLPAPQKIDTELWLDEAIWGHRLYDEQTPWMTFLEMLGVLATQRGPAPFCEPDGLGGVAYVPARRMALRNILFNNPFLDEIKRRVGSDAARWEAWIARMKTEAEGVGDETDFSYLRKVFTARSESFAEFAEVVRLLRTTAIEGDSNKRWTSKFAFPYGPACLYPDLRLKPGGELDMDRRFFARTGELVYLMLCRSGRGPELYEALRPVVLDHTAPWNRLVERLQPPCTAPVIEARTGFLPYAQHLDFTAFAGDLITVLDAKLPGARAPEPPRPRVASPRAAPRRGPRRVRAGHRARLAPGHTPRSLRAERSAPQDARAHGRARPHGVSALSRGPPGALQHGHRTPPGRRHPQGGRERSEGVRRQREEARDAP